MEEAQYIGYLEEKVLTLETQIRHLRNDLRLTREENETATTMYFELYSNLEDMVAERTRDVKALRRILEQKANELEIMLDSSPAMVFYKDVDQTLIRANSKFAKATGFSLNDILGRKYHEFFSDYAQEYLERDLEVIRTAVPLLNKKESLNTPEGKRRVLIDRIPYKGAGKKVIGIIGFALDITDLEKVEQDKMRLEGQLQHALRMKSVGTLAGGVAHNFNNMLMGILGNTSLALLQTSPEQPLYSNLKAIQKLVHSGSELTKQLLGYAMEGGYEPKVMSLNMLVKELSETFATMRKEVLVHCQFDEDLHPVVADRAQIEQVLLNLYLNAADAMPNGGSLYLRTMNATKDDMAGQPYTPKQGNYAHLSVRDTGTGMDKETLGRIFEPFFTTKGLAKGTGLGLASSYGIIKAHGGYIDVESEVGNGTTFHIYLPAGNGRIPEETEATTPLSSGKGTILVVDDENMILELGQEMLKALGYEVFSAGSGNEALKLYVQHLEQIDMVLLDMIMPEMSGGDVYDSLKKINPKVKVLLSSGYTIDGQAKEILNRGCDGFIQKPFDLGGLSRSVESILDNKHVWPSTS